MSPEKKTPMKNCQQCGNRYSANPPDNGFCDVCWEKYLRWDADDRAEQLGDDPELEEEAA